MRFGIGMFVCGVTLGIGCAADVPAPDIAGATLYATNGCGTCHGQQGHGDGPLAKTLKPPPRDFRDPLAFKKGADRDSIALTVRTGLTRDGGQMQAYGHLTDDERLRIADHVISLRQAFSQGTNDAASRKP